MISRIFFVVLCFINFNSYANNEVFVSVQKCILEQVLVEKLNDNMNVLHEGETIVALVTPQEIFKNIQIFKEYSEEEKVGLFKKVVNEDIKTKGYNILSIITQIQRAYGDNMVKKVFEGVDLSNLKKNKQFPVKILLKSIQGEEPEEQPQDDEKKQPEEQPQDDEKKQPAFSVIALFNESSGTKTQDMTSIMHKI